MPRRSRFPRTILNFRCCTECAPICSAGSSRMAIAFAYTSPMAATGFLILCDDSRSVRPMSVFFSAISYAGKLYPRSSHVRRCPLELRILGRRRLVFFVCRSAPRDHANAMLGTQCNRCEEFDCVSWDNFEMIALLNHGQQQRGFHHRKGSANTNSRPSSEGEIRETRNFARANGVFPPAFGIESFRVGEKARIALRAPLQNED